MLISKSYKKGVVTSTALNAIVKGINFLNIIIIARLYGTSIDTDIYFYLFAFVNLVATFINGLDLTVIIPEGMHLQETKGRAAAMGFYNFFGLVYCLLGLLLFIILFFFSIPVFEIISTFKDAVLLSHRSLLMLSSVLPLFIIVSSYLSTVLTTLKFFIAPLIVSLTVQTLTLGMLLLFYKKLGINAAMVGLVTGYGLNIILLLAIMWIKLKWSFTFSKQELTKRIGKNLFSVSLGNIASTAYTYGIILILSSLTAGYYSAYNYSMQIVNIPVTFIVAQAAAVIGIKFNELSARQEHNQLNKIFQDSTAILLFLLVPICFLTFLYAEDVVRFLFFRGGFGEQSVIMVSQFLRYLIFLTPCFLLVTFITRVLTANRKVSQSFYFQIVFNLVSLGSLYIGFRLYQGNGFLIAMLVTYYLYITIGCLLLFKWLLPYISYKQTLRQLMLMALLNIPFLLVCKMLAPVHSIGLLAMVAFIYYGLLMIVNHFLRVNEPARLFLFQLINLGRGSIKTIFLTKNTKATIGSL